MARRAAKEIISAPHPVVVMDNTSKIIEAIIRAAADPKIDVVKMERLVAMQEQMETRAAKVAFDDNLANAQFELPEINRYGRIVVRRKDPKTGERTGQVEQSTSYAKWEDINDVLKPILHKYGFSLSFRTGFDDQGRIKVTAILARGGHREETTMILQHDATGSKNAVQAVGSSTSYGKRYTACALLNITTRGEDDDGATYRPKAERAINAVQLAELIELADEVGADKARFCKMLKVESMPDIPALRFEEAKAQLLRKKKAKSAKSDFPGDRPL